MRRRPLATALVLATLMASLAAGQQDISPARAQNGSANVSPNAAQEVSQRSVSSASQGISAKPFPDTFPDSEIPNISGLSHELRSMVGVEQAALALPPAAAAEGARRPERGKVAAKYDIDHIGARGIGGGVNFYSLEREQQLGRAMAADVEHESQLVADPVVTEYVNRIGQNIVRNSDAKLPFVIKVLDNDEINAFALPGGYFYVNSGLILAADNEAELAGVMAHEVAHVAARHATKNVTRAQIWNLVSIPLVFIGGPAGYAVRQIAGLAVPMSFLKFSRDAEREADLLGLEYQYASGYDPAAFVQFFEKLYGREKEKHSRLAKAFSTHPMSDDRIKHAEDEIEKVLPAKDEYIITTSEFDEVKARLMALTDKHRIDEGKGVRPTLRKRIDGRDK
jgi:beta-barrel assembly-enhancing protease